MKKVILFIFIFILSGCSKITTPKTPNDILLSIKDYSCKMQINYFSNKNTTQYQATQSYSSSGKYSMEFLDKENMKINYTPSTLNISSKLFEEDLNIANYLEQNQNPLFLSYFIHNYFNSEEAENVETSENYIQLQLPNYSNYLHTAKLTFKDNLPHMLSYFDENGNEKVNIIYNEFNFSNPNV